MRFCLINNLYPPLSRGGAERIVELIVNQLQKHGEVLVVTSQPDLLLDCQINGNFEICRLNPLNTYHLLEDFKKTKAEKFIWHFNDFFSGGILRQVEGILNKKKIDFVFTHNLNGLSLGIPKVIRKLNLTHIHTLHDYQLLDPHGSMHRQGQNLALNSGFYQLYRYFTRQAIKSPNLVISPSEFVLAKHKEYGFFKKSKTAVLPNPVEFYRAHLDEFRRINSDKLRLLYLGQIESHKGVEFLVNSFIKWNNHNAELTIAGEGSCLEKVRMLGSEDARIKILGKVEREKMPELFSQTDLLVVPSIWWENSPTVVYEACSYKVPVLVSDSGGSKELVKEGKTGWIFKSGNQDDMISKLNMALKEKDQLIKMGESGYQFIQNFSADKYADKLLELCQSLRK